jgi:hypothetical protein
MLDYKKSGASVLEIYNYGASDDFSKKLYSANIHKHNFHSAFSMLSNLDLISSGVASAPSICLDQ